MFELLSQRFKVPIMDLLIHAPVPEREDLENPLAWRTFNHAENRELTLGELAAPFLAYDVIIREPLGDDDDSDDMSEEQLMQIFTEVFSVVLLKKRKKYLKMNNVD